MYDENKIYPTNYAQKTMVLERKLLSDPLVYNLFSLFKLVGRIDKEKFYHSFAAVIARHSALRTYFVEQNDEIYQKIASKVEYETPVYKVNTTEELYNLKRSLNTPFDLTKPPLFKTALIELNDETYFFISFHHSIADGTSTVIFFQEILDIYSDKKLKEVKYSAIDYALEEKERRNILESQEQYWLNMYKDGVPPLDFPTDAPRPAVLSHKGRRLVFDIDEALAGEIKQIARKNQAVPFSVMLAAYAVLLARYSGKEDLVVGVPFAGRVQRKYAKTIGMFVNNLAWRIKPEADKTFVELIQEIQTEKDEISLNQEYPLAQLVKKLELPLDMSHNSMFDVVFNFMPAFGTLKSDAIAMEFVRDDEDPAVADLAFRVNKLTKSYYIELTYSEVLFNKATMEQFSRDYISLLHEIKHNPTIELSKLKIMNEADRQKLTEFNRTAADYDRSLTMVDLLTKSVRLYPDRYAVKAKDSALTYKEFDLRTNRIAHALATRGIGREDIVAFMLPRTSDLICVIYGIMKAGAAFLPIDPEYPSGRIEHILNDSQAKYLITTENAANLPDKIKQTIQLEELLSCRDESPIATAGPENLCYIIYTSGSTGKPKGVMIEHRNAVNFSQPLSNNLLTKSIVEQSKTVLGIGTIAFDIALSEIFPALSNGLSFVLASEDEVNQADALGQLMLQEKVDTLQITPSRLIPFLDNEVFAAALKNLKLLLSAAEVFTPEMLQRLRALTSALILNGYGPSECTIGATFAAVTDNNVTIGKPISNTEIHILDKYNNEVPVGVFGELCIGGYGVGRGYYGQPELTAKKFTLWQGKRIYHTGDIAAWQRNGSLSFKGRIDDLVKLHGLRIELGEIESNMLKFTGIKRALVLVRKIGNSEYLCAYYQTDRKIDVFELRTKLAESLVYYMIPQVFTEMKEFPLTPNGKIDKKALPEPELKAEEIVAPETEKEKAILKTVKELLQTEELGVTNNLFNLGLTSIMAIKLNVLLQKNLLLNISTNEILKNPTIKQIAALAVEEANEVKLYDRRAYYPLTENQKGLYIEWEKNREALQYNVPLCLRFVRLETEKLKEALLKVLEAHPYLKTRLKITDTGETVQLRLDEAEPEISIQKLTGEPDESFFANRVRPFDLLKDPLYRLEIYETEEHTYLFTDIHHIIYDGGSSNIFFNDLSRAYAGEKLEAETFTAFDRALEEEEILNSDKYSEAEKYFDRLLAETEPTDFKPIIPAQGTGKAATERTELVGQPISEYCHSHAITENVFFLTAFMEVLRRLTGEKNIQITSISNGRSGVHLENVMGMFVKTIPVVYKAEGDTAEQTMKAVQEQVFATLSRDYYPLTVLAERNGVRPLINYVYQGGIGEAVSLELDTVKFNLALTVYPVAENYALELEYDDDLYSAQDIQLILKTLSVLLKEITVREGLSLNKLSIIDSEEKGKLIKLGSGKQLAYDRTETFMDLFNRQVTRVPNNIAVAAENGRLTYLELAQRSDALAAELQKLGIGQNKFVCIMLPRIKEYMISTLGVFKAGGAYVPLDSEYPNERLLYMLADSQSEVLITTRDLYEQKQKEGNFTADNIIFVDEFDFNAVSQAGNDSQVDSLAYMIYTSGSTGKPKGVMIQHKSLTSFVHTICDIYNLSEADKIACHSSFSFDASVEDLYPVLTKGGELHIIGEDLRHDLTLLYHYLLVNGITGGCYTTQLGIEFLTQFKLPVRYLTVGGEKMNKNIDTKVQVFNTYGPTEFTVDATYYPVDEKKAYDNIPIGYPMYNSWVYVVDQQLNLVPEGVIGELCLSGIQIAKGYWQRSDLTAERFVDNPYKNGPENEKMYRTGDLVRWNEAGELEYFGRMDNQVKLRGFRIEMGEIETRLSQFAGMTGAVAEIKEVGGVQHLCAYYMAETEINTENLRSYLAEALTDYMVPTAYMQLEKLPLTPNGKVDRKSLPEPKIARIADYVAPTNDLEEQICQVFSELLNNDEVGILDDFFSIGGTSILAIKAIIMINNLGYNIQYGNLFNWKTPQMIARHLLNSEEETPEFFALEDYDYTTVNSVLSKNTDGFETDFSIHAIGDVLLTGATGYLGVHVLHDLLTKGQGKIYCLLRASENLNIVNRLKMILMYYFDDTYEELFDRRIFLLEGDIADKKSLQQVKDYSIQTVINCAAIVKHYEAGNKMEQVNYNGVLNLIELCQQQDMLLVQTSTYSTSGILAEGRTLSTDKFSESSLYIGQSTDNKYIWTKFKAERAILEAVGKGLKAKIMRLGNLMARALDGEFQINSGNNAFLNLMKSYKIMGAFPIKQITESVELSQIDKVAEAIVLLSATPDNMVVFHPYNNFEVNMGILLNGMKKCGYDLSLISEEEFIAKFNAMMRDEKKSSYLSGMLHYGKMTGTEVPVNNDFTTVILYKLGFIWPLPDKTYVEEFIEKIDGLGFFEEI